jgi:hypothetical protein
MALTLSQLERGPDGAYAQCVLRHRDPGYTVDLPLARFVDGVTIEPVGGRALARIVAEMGADLSIDRAPVPAVMPAPAKPPVAAVAPVTVAAPPVELADQDRDMLAALAEAQGIPVQDDWSIQRIRKALRSKGL